MISACIAARVRRLERRELNNINIRSTAAEGYRCLEKNPTFQMPMMPMWFSGRTVEPDDRGSQVVDIKSGTRDSNPRLQPWQIGAQLRTNNFGVHVLRSESMNSMEFPQLSAAVALIDVEVMYTVRGRNDAGSQTDDSLPMFCSVRLDNHEV